MAAFRTHLPGRVRHCLAQSGAESRMALAFLFENHLQLARIERIRQQGVVYFPMEIFQVARTLACIDMLLFEGASQDLGIGRGKIASQMIQHLGRVRRAMWVVEMAESRPHQESVYHE